MFSKGTVVVNAYSQSVWFLQINQNYCFVIFIRFVVCISFAAWVHIFRACNHYLSPPLWCNIFPWNQIYKTTCSDREKADSRILAGNARQSSNGQSYTDITPPQILGRTGKRFQYSKRSSLAHRYLICTATPPSTTWAGKRLYHTSQYFNGIREISPLGCQKKAECNSTIVPTGIEMPWELTASIRLSIRP